jgi:ABC-2 type transport system permease protein
MAEHALVQRPVSRPPGPLLIGQARFAMREFWRTPVAAFFTLALPLLFLLLVGLTAGNVTIDTRGGIRIAQFYTPSLVAFAVAIASFTTPATAIALARENGVLKRLRGTPLPAWAYLGGRMASALTTAVLSVAVMMVVAVVVLDVRIITGSIAAALAALLVGVATFGALAFALAAVVSSSATMQAISYGSVILLAFVSEIFVPERMPGWLLAVGDIFPLKHFANALQRAFDPYLTGSPWAWDDLAVMALWGAGAAAIALLRFRWEPAQRGSSGGGYAATVHPTAAHAKGTPGAVRGSRPGRIALVAGQIGYANRTLWRDPGSVFFAIVMPVGLILLLPAVFGTGPVPFGEGLRFPLLYAPAMAVYGIAVHAFVNVPETIATARDKGVLKRLRGTPLSPGQYLAGRFGSIILVAALITTATMGAAALLYDVTIPLARLPVALLIFLLGTASIAALGLMVAALVPNARSVPAVALAILLPLCFVSDIFLLVDLPTILTGIGWAFPLKHFVHAMVTAFNPAAASGLAWDHLAVLVGWGIAGALIAARTFRWQPRIAG